MQERWYESAVIYCLDVDTFQDDDGDGVGDLRGLIRRLDHLVRLGVTCLWLNPVHPSPDRDDGYDVTDFYAVDPRLGTLGDFVELVHRARDRGLRAIIDLVVNHTSDEHPWFRSARSSPDSPHRDWYVWSTAEPEHRTDGVVFPGVQEETWTFDEEAGAWYHHRFHAFQPDLNWANPEVRAEVGRIVGFWLQLGVSGFRMDAAPFLIEDPRPDRAGARREYGWLTDLRRRMSWQRGDAVVLAEANVERDELLEFFGAGDRLHLLFHFAINQRVFLALARGSAAPLREALAATPTLPPGGAWASFLRNHDEVDLSGLTPSEREECFAAFGPDPSMQLYGRGIRRRLAPMLGDDRRRIELAYALQCCLPGTPVLRYGDEIGMGDDLSLPDRDAIRTPMQWSDEPAGGFSTAPAGALRRPVIAGGDHGFEVLNVDAQRDDDGSLLAWFERMIRALRECPELGAGAPTVLDAGADHVLALLRQADDGRVLAVCNLADEPRTLDLRSELDPVPERVVEVFADRRYGPTPVDVGALELAGFGYRWLRLR